MRMTMAAAVPVAPATPRAHAMTDAGRMDAAARPIERPFSALITMLLLLGLRDPACRQDSAQFVCRTDQDS
jgi:hypothetical protein